MKSISRKSRQSSISSTDSVESNHSPIKDRSRSNKIRIEVVKKEGEKVSRKVSNDAFQKKSAAPAIKNIVKMFNDPAGKGLSANET